MTLKEFIFSKSYKRRIARHVTFWLAYTFYFFLQSIPPKTFEELATVKPYFTALINTVCFAPFYFAVTYYFIYSVYPGTIKKEKYFLFVLAFLLSYAMGVLINYFTAQVFLQETLYQPATPENRLSLSYCNTRWGMIIGIIGIGIKLSKDWYHQQVENTRLFKRKNKAELKLRKSRLHPKLLLRTLDNIHSSVSNDFIHSGEMILKLSDVLSYSLYDSDEELVTVEKEIEAVKSLIMLEQLGSSINGKVNVNIPDSSTHYCIAPMIFVKLIEECITLITPGKSIANTIIVDISSTTEHICLLVQMQSKHDRIPVDNCNRIVDRSINRLQEHYAENDYHITCTHTAQETILKLTLHLSQQEQDTLTRTLPVYENA